MMTAEEFLNLLPNLSDGVLQQDYLKKSELHHTIISATKLLEDEIQATRLIDLAFQVNPKLAAKLAGAAIFPVEEAVSQRFKALVEDRTWREYLGINLKIYLLCETLAIWVIPDLEELLQQGYSPYKTAVALTRIATQAESNTTKDAAIFALMGGLENKNKRVRSSAIRHLGFRGCNVATESLLAILKNDPDWTIRCDAAEALGKIKDLRAVDGLMAALQDPQGHVCNYSIVALRNLKSTKPVELLIGKLEDPKPSIRWASATALGKICSDLAINPLISNLKDPDPATRWTSIEALGNIENEKAIAPLIHALEDEHIMVRKTAIIALGQIGSDIAITPLTEIFDHSDSFLRKEIILALDKITRINEKQLPIQFLLSALKDCEFEVKQLAAQKLLSKTNHCENYPQFLLNGLKNSSIMIRMESARLLEKVTPRDLDILGIDSVIDNLINNLINENCARVKRVTINSLGQFQNPKAIAPLISILQNSTEHRRVRRDAIYALEKISLEQVLKPCKIALTDPIPSVRIAASSVLSRIADDCAIKDLVASLGDTEWRVIHNSGKALAKINKPQVEKELLRTLQNSQTTIIHRKNIFSLLPKVGSKKSFDILIYFFTDYRKPLKIEAVNAISQFARDRADLNYINIAVNPLITTFHDLKNSLRKAITIALGEIALHLQCEEKNRSLIISTLEIAKSDRNHDVRNSAIRYLLDIPRQNAFDYLIQKLDSSDIWVVEQAVERLGKMIHSQAVTKLAKLTLTDAQIELAIAKLQQASTNSNRRISQPAQKILAQLNIN